MAVYIINIKILIDELTNGEAIEEAIFSPTETSGLDTSSVNEAPNRVGYRSSTASNASQSPMIRNNFFGKKSIEALKKTINKSRDRFTKTKQSDNIPKSPVLDFQIDRGGKPDKFLVGALVSFIHGWGLDAELDEFCINQLNLQKPSLGSLGCRGYYWLISSAGGYLSFPFPQKDKESTPIFPWTISPHLTTQRLLTIVAMVRSLIKNYELPHDPTEVMKRFGQAIPSIIAKGGAQLSLPILTRFWQDSVGN